MQIADRATLRVDAAHRGNVQISDEITLAVYSNTTTLRDILWTYGHSWSNSRKNAANAAERKFRGNGLSSVSKNEDGSVYLFFDVGCWCEHDCCGCLCHVHHDIFFMANCWHVYSHHAHNY